jgi:hypothetical protein
MAALKKELSGKYDIYPNSDDDSIVCLQIYTGIPAYVFSWTIDGQRCYEANSAAVGLHMNEGPIVDGESNWKKNWRRFPSLRRDSTLEEVVLNDADALLKRAEVLGLLRAENKDNNTYYHVTILQPDSKETAQSLFDQIPKKDDSLIDVDNFRKLLEGTNPDIKERALEFSGMVMTFDPDQKVTIPTDWYRKLAVKILRKRLDYMEELQKSLVVFAQLKTMLDERNAIIEQVLLFKKLFPLFCKCWEIDLITYDEAKETWKSLDERNRTLELLNELEYPPRTLRSYALYFVFVVFLKLDPMIIDFLEEKIRDHDEEMKKNPERNAYLKGIHEKKTKLANVLETLINFRDKWDSLDGGIIRGSIEYPMRLATFENDVDHAIKEKGTGKKIDDFFHKLLEYAKQ